MHIETFEHFPDGVIALDQQGLIIFINTEACTLLNLSAVRIQNKKLITEILSINNSPLNLLSQQNATSMVGTIQVKGNNQPELHAKICYIPNIITQEGYSLLTFKDLSHEVELDAKYQIELREKDQKIKEVGLINSILNNIRSLPDANLIIEQIALHVMTDLKIDYSLLITDTGKEFLVSLIATGERQSIALRLGFPITIRSLGKIGDIIRSGSKAQLPTDLIRSWDHPYFLEFPLLGKAKNLYLFFPLRQEISANQLTMFNNILHQTSSAIDAGIYQRLANTDELTEVYNRRYFHLCADPFFEGNSEEGDNCTFIILDIDHFKKINDSYGHSFGDLVLKTIGEVLRREVRIGDIAARIGGEEFAVLLPDTGSGLAMIMAERLRNSLAITPIERDGVKIFITASFGVAGKIECGARSIEQLMDLADKALYHSKHNGRNRVTLAQ